jgi:hypothetical protein
MSSCGTWKGSERVPGDLRISLSMGLEFDVKGIMTLLYARACFVSHQNVMLSLHHNLRFLVSRTREANICPPFPLLTHTSLFELCSSLLNPRLESKRPSLDSPDRRDSYAS